MLSSKLLKKINLTLITPTQSQNKLKSSRRTTMEHSSSLPIIETTRGNKPIRPVGLFKKTTLPMLQSSSPQKRASSLLNEETEPLFSKRKKKKYSERYQLLLNNLYLFDPIQEKKLKQLKKDNSIVFSKRYTIERYQTKLVKVLSTSTDTEALMQLRDNFKELNEKCRNDRVLLKNNKWSLLAKQLRNNIPTHLSQKFIAMGGNKYIKK